MLHQCQEVCRVHPAPWHCRQAHCTQKVYCTEEAATAGCPLWQDRRHCCDSQSAIQVMMVCDRQWSLLCYINVWPRALMADCPLTPQTLIGVKQSLCLHIRGSSELAGVDTLLSSLCKSPAAGANMGDAADAVMPTAGQGTAKICLITGFESFNSGLYQKVNPAMLLTYSPPLSAASHLKHCQLVSLMALNAVQVAHELRQKIPNVELMVFSDRDLDPKRAQIEEALNGADVFFGSLLFDYDQVTTASCELWMIKPAPPPPPTPAGHAHCGYPASINSCRAWQVEWLRARVSNIPVRLVFESALELMSCTEIGTFQVSQQLGQQKPLMPKMLASAKLALLIWVCQQVAATMQVAAGLASKSVLARQAL